MTRIKICGLARREDAELAIELGADALGFVFEPTSPRYVGDQAELIAWVWRRGPFDPRIVAVYGVCQDDPVDFDLVQAHTFKGVPTPERLLVVRPTPGFLPETLLETIDRVTPWALTLDAYHPDQHGGTGHRLDPAFFEMIGEVLVDSGKDLPIILSGGLTPDTVAEAIRRVQPYGVDVSSGIESAPGRKDPTMMRDFIQAVREIA